MSEGPNPKASAGADLLVARQPILDRQLRPHGYELLFRASQGSVGPADLDPARATAVVVARSFLTLGLSTVTGGRPAFLNVGATLLAPQELAALPPDVVVIELAAELDATDPPVVEGLRHLRDQGYRLVLDQLAREDDPRLGLLGLVDGAKVDFATSDGRSRERLVTRLQAAGLEAFATKVETREQADEAFEIGCDYLQGYFFAEPLVISRRQLPGFKPMHLRLLEAIRRDELDFAELEHVIRSDLLLSHQFLRYINMSSFGWRRTITSLHHAFVLLGEERARQWVALVVMADLAQDKPKQLAVTACLRARFCELIGSGARQLSERTLDLFLLGMFSVVDAILDRPMVAALSGMPLPQDVTAALLGEHSRVGVVLDVVKAYERGEWAALELLCTRLGLDEATLLPHYLEAVEWVSSIFEQDGMGDDA